MNNTRLTTLLLSLLLLATTPQLHAQDFFTGKMIVPGKADQEIYYDRTQFTLNGFTFQTIYKVMNKSQRVFNTLTLTHDRSESLIYVASKKDDGTTKEFTIQYDANSSGVFFSSLGNLDSFYTVSRPYNYLFSFTDLNRDYPIVHKLRIDNGNSIILDPVTKIRLKKQQEAMKKIAPWRKLQEVVENQLPGQKQAEEEFFGIRSARDKFFAGPFYTDIMKMRDEFNARNKKLQDSIARVKTYIKIALEEARVKKIVPGDYKYKGDKVKGVPEGWGLLVTNGNVYSGMFRGGQFVSGEGDIKNEVYEFCGEYKSYNFNGSGWMKFHNGDYKLGKFQDGEMIDGIQLAKDKDGTVYYGSFKNEQRSGYGEMKNGRGDFWFGQFFNGKLIKGYSQEFDRFGNATYTKIENGNKSVIEPIAGKEFFDKILSKK